jgi:hypothetical protein
LGRASRQLLDVHHLIGEPAEEEDQPIGVVAAGVCRAQNAVVVVAVLVVVARELEEILEVVTALIEQQRGEHPRGSPVAVDEGVDPYQSMLGDSGLDDRVNPRVVAAVAQVHTRLRDAPEGRPVEARPCSDAKIVGLPRVGGLHHRYVWREAAY